jgi:FAD/FMN-containing dehydrogenase
MYVRRDLQKGEKNMPDNKNFNISEHHRGYNRDSEPNLALNGISLSNVKADIKGSIFLPGETEYDESRTLFYGGFDRHPAIVIRPADVSDVAYVVSLARKHGIELAVRSGGHSTGGYSVSNGGIVLDLRDMRALDIDPDNRTAWAETGLTAGEFSKAAGAYGLAIGFGDTGSVGIGGITLGGGVGYLVRKHGLTIDNLLAAELVTADGKILYVDHEKHPDLFWAIRGGGGNFGVATRFKYHLHSVDQVLGGMLFLPATPEVIASFINEAEAAPEELSTIANVMPAPPMPFVPAELHGQMIIIAMMVYAGDLDAGLSVVAPFRKLGPPLTDMLRPMPYSEMLPPEDEGYHPTAAGRTMFIDHVNTSVAKTIIDALESSDAPMRVAQLRVLGGAVARVPDDATAYAHRKSRIMVNVAAFYSGEEDKQVREEWVDNFAAALNQGNSGAYVNFLGNEGEERVRAAYPGSTWDRLAAIKARYDPTNLFRLNSNIPPSAEAIEQLHKQEEGRSEGS